MKIYTKTGDKGVTSLYGGLKVPKNHIRIESYGTIDELNSNIGIIRSLNINLRIDEYLNKIQNQLFNLGTELAIPNEKFYLENKKLRFEYLINFDQIQEMETQIDTMNEQLPELQNFILPFGNQLIAQTHLARTVCRRTERIVVSLSEFEKIRDEIIMYLNRLSDYLFILARFFSKELNIKEIKWQN